MEMHRALMSGLLCTAGLLISGTAAADPLPYPGGASTVWNGLAGTTRAAEPQLMGTVVEDTVTPFSYEGWYTGFDANEGSRTTYGNVTGAVRQQVVLSVDGTYDFYWRLHVNDDSFLPVMLFNITGFPHATYNANWLSDSQGDVQPGGVAQSAAGTEWAFVVYEPPSHQLRRGEDSYWFFLDSQARGYTNTGSFSFTSGRDSGGLQTEQWGGVSGTYATFAPVPEPSPLALFPAGLLMLGAMRRYRVLASAASAR